MTLSCRACRDIVEDIRTRSNESEFYYHVAGVRLGASYSTSRLICLLFQISVMPTVLTVNGISVHAAFSTELSSFQHA